MRNRRYNTRDVVGGPHIEVWFTVIMGLANDKDIGFMRAHYVQRPFCSAVALACVLLFSAAGESACDETDTIVSDDSEAVLVFVGDVMLARNLPPHSPYNPEPLNHAYIFEPTAAIFHAADIAFCNLESPISGRGKPLNKRYAFNAPPDAAQGLRTAGFDIVSLANNHCLDYGDIALEDTMTYLASQDIHFVGICERDKPQDPVILTANTIRVGYLAYMCPELYFGEVRNYSPGPALAKKETVVEDVRQLRAQADIIVVSFHWGIEYTIRPTRAQQQLGRATIDAGAHIVAGHHPHVQQEPERYAHGLILYSMGNFVFARYSRPPARDTRIYRININRDGIAKAEYLAHKIVPDRWRPEPQSSDWRLVADNVPKREDAVVTCDNTFSDKGE